MTSLYSQQPTQRQIPEDSCVHRPYTSLSEIQYASLNNRPRDKNPSRQGPDIMTRIPSLALSSYHVIRIGV